METAVTITADNYEAKIEELQKHLDRTTYRAHVNEERAHKLWKERREAISKLNDAIIDKYILRNQLVLSEIRYKEQKRYLEAYQKLYLREVLRNEREKRNDESDLC